MRKFMNKKLILILAIILICFCGSNVMAATKEQINAAVDDTAAYLLHTVKEPQVGSVGGEWAILGLARSDYDVADSYFANYYKNVEQYVKACNGILHEKKYTEYSRVILALTALGYDPTAVGGYDLTLPLADYEKTTAQGINGAIFALLALDSGNYAIPSNPAAITQATRELYVEKILSLQLPDGGFSLSGSGVADPDLTAMALQALAKYEDHGPVKNAIAKALLCLSAAQNGDGGYSSWQTTNSESVGQVIVALGELGISIDDPRFVKNGHTLADNLLTYYVKGQGFVHSLDVDGANGMATEQAFYALVALERMADGKNSLYDMSDIQGPKTEEADQINRHNDVKVMPIIAPGKTFADIQGHANHKAIEALAARGIITGVTSQSFLPDAEMTRAEFATIVIRALGLQAKTNAVFSDIPPKSWYAGYVGAAYDYGIVNGTGAGIFAPDAIITREQAAVMVANAAALCGRSGQMTDSDINEALNKFADQAACSSWARPALAFCYDEGILGPDDNLIQPQTAIKRCEIAQMLYNLLEAADLL